MHKVLLLLIPILIITGCNKNTEEESQLIFTEKTAGVWAARVSSEKFVSLLEVAGIKPRIDAINKLGDQAFPLSQKHISVRTNESHINLKFPLEPDEQIFGLGLYFKSVYRRGNLYRLHVDHYIGMDVGRTHAPVPLIISSRGYGILINSARYLDVYVGTANRKNSPNHPEPRDRNTDPSWAAQPVSDAIEIRIPDDNAEVIIFAGPEPMDVIKRYNLYCGGGCLPPKWGLGFWHRVPTLYTDEQVKVEADQFKEHGFPLDVLGLEPGWQSKSYPCTYAWDKDRFPDPDKFIAEMKSRGIQLNLWMNPYISPESPIYEKLKAFTGSHTVWLGEVPDYFMPEAEKITKDYFEEELVKKGISGFKVDECDGYDFWLWPDVATFPSGLDGEQMRQVYALKLMNMLTDIYYRNNQRTYGLVRAANAGASHFPFVLYNDYYSHPDFITALVNSGFNGVLWVPEARSSKSAEEWLRRIQSVCFSPIAMINAWADGTKPWSFPSVYKNVQEVAILRMRFLPYIYSLFAKYHSEGVPPFFSMNLLEGFDDQGREIKSQYMMGKDVLVAPMFAGQNTREVLLPKGNWYDFYNGNFVGKDEIIKINPGIEHIPMFVRDGGIIPLGPEILSAAQLDADIPLEVRHYGKADGSFLLYDDDGQTFDFERGAYTWRKLSATQDKDGSFLGTISAFSANTPWSYGKINWRFMTE
jgi:alpha-D-xyloside xylohydrolase